MSTFLKKKISQRKNNFYVTTFENVLKQTNKQKFFVIVVVLNTFMNTTRK